MRMVGYKPGCKTCFCVVGDEVGAAIWPLEGKPSTAIAAVPQPHHNHAPDYEHPLASKVRTRRAPRGPKPSERMPTCTASTAASQR